MGTLRHAGTVARSQGTRRYPFCYARKDESDGRTKVRHRVGSRHRDHGEGKQPERGHSWKWDRHCRAYKQAHVREQGTCADFFQIRPPIATVHDRTIFLAFPGHSDERVIKLAR